jgi:hypothetical protein
MLTTILIFVAIAVAAILIYAATKPGSFRVQRTAAIGAPADKIFPRCTARSPTWQSS